MQSGEPQGELTCCRTLAMKESCAYSHHTSVLERIKRDWSLVMYEVYWDDSGTDRDSPLAIAACYISTKRGWDAFVEAFDEIRWSEGFETFHMVEFAASHDKTKKPFCDWDRVKRKRVYERIAKAINEHKRTGMESPSLRQRLTS